ncbi:hypothetical protein SAMN05421640_0097 [Ekhidna lutea]|uniref:Uncharacterized protein n=1 Tax=Ekhidna lutea TaxID=447679 RepID=A0A239EFN1_EKHLU|nr:hypothetical protein [Ekhidna lutea]SNS42823.1 hypothetical protein SAMN05421640_0097 [Ekhidna lutea]
MKSSLLNKTIETQRLQLSRWHAFEYYFSVFFIVGLSVYMMFSDYIMRSEEFASSNLSFNSFFIGIGLLIFLNLRKKLKLQFYHLKVDYNQIQMALNQTKKDLGWNIVTNNENVIQAKRNWGNVSFGGELITIIPRQNGLLINSISDPDLRTPSLFFHKTNVRTFLINLYNVVNDTKIKKPEELENKWSTGNLIFRLVAYPFCLVSIITSIFFIIPEGNYTLGVGLSLFCLFYLVSDISRLIN